MVADYEIALATPDDIPGILSLQEPNLVERGGGLSVRQTADWYRNAIVEKSVVVGRREGKVVGYVLGTSLAAKAHVAIIQTMLRTFPAPPDRYLLHYRPGIPVAEPWQEFLAELQSPVYQSFLRRMLGDHKFIPTFEWYYAWEGCAV